MKRLVLFLSIFIATAAIAQVSNPSIIYVSSAPTGLCAVGSTAQLVISTGVIYTCQLGTWAASSGSGSPSGAASGDLGGSYPSPTVVNVTGGSGPSRIGPFKYARIASTGINTTLCPNTLPLLSSLSPSSTQEYFVCDAATVCDVATGGGSYIAPAQWNGSAWASALAMSGITVNGHSLCSNVTVSASDLSTGTLPAAQLPAVATLVSSGAIATAANSTIVVCTTTCTITPITPAAGVQLCARNGPGVSSVITLAALTGVYYEKTDHSAWASSSGHTMTSSGATTDMVCIVGYDANHYALASQVGMTTN